MLVAYFDDSGTHDASRFVLLGGLYADEKRWSAFDADWRFRLAAPVPGKPALKRFHMAECEAGEGEFASYNRAERDLLIHDLREIIVRHTINGYVCGVSRSDWDALVQGDVRAFLGDAERFCVTQCFVWTIFKVAKPHAVSEVGFVFDNRPHREAANRRVFEFFERHRQVVQEGPVIAPISFQSSVESPPLQASDLVAWEYYQFGLQWLRAGAAALRRPHLQRLAEARLLEVQFAGPEQIRPLVGFNQEQVLLREFGAAFEKGLASLPPWMR
jgi:hypothetical protein